MAILNPRFSILDLAIARLASEIFLSSLQKSQAVCDVLNDLNVWNGLNFSGAWFKAFK
jgi:hypothetical protein